MKGKMHRFYLIRPRANLNVTEICESLLALRPVKSVILTEGDYGYLVKARFSNNKEPKALENYLKKNLDSKFGTLMVDAHFSK